MVKHHSITSNKKTIAILSQRLKVKRFLKIIDRDFR